MFIFPKKHENWYIDWPIHLEKKWIWTKAYIFGFSPKLSILLILYCRIMLYLLKCCISTKQLLQRTGDSILPQKYWRVKVFTILKFDTFPRPVFILQTTRFSSLDRKSHSDVLCKKLFIKSRQSLGKLPLNKLTFW